MATAKQSPETNVNPSAPQGWEDEQTGFPPYWNPEVGKAFRGVVLGLDEKDPDFPRYAFKATDQVMCARGPADEAEKVIIKPGEFFSCSAYAALPLQRYIGFEVYVMAKNKRDIKGGKELWEFSLKIHPEEKKKLLALEAKRLSESNASSNPL
jgi:hypothetical protein